MTAVAVTAIVLPQTTTMMKAPRPKRPRLTRKKKCPTRLKTTSLASSVISLVILPKIAPMK